MKIFLIYSSFFLASFSFSQAWKDSLNTARKLYKEGKYVESFDKYKSARKSAPKNIDLSDEIGQSAYKANEFKQAEKLYKQSSSKMASTQQKAKTYHNIGNSKLKQKNYKEAVEAYKEALRNNPKDEQTRYNLAEAMKKQKSQDKQKNQSKNNHKQEPKEDNKNKAQNPSKDSDKEKKDSEKQENQASQKEQKSQLDDKKTDRILDDLAKKEMETKKKIGKGKSKNKSTKSGKDW